MIFGIDSAVGVEHSPTNGGMQPWAIGAFNKEVLRKPVSFDGFVILEKTKSTCRNCALSFAEASHVRSPYMAVCRMRCLSGEGAAKALNIIFCNHSISFAAAADRAQSSFRKRFTSLSVSFIGNSFYRPILAKAFLLRSAIWRCSIVFLAHQRALASEKVMGISEISSGPNTGVMATPNLNLKRPMPIYMTISVLKTSIVPCRVKHQPLISFIPASITALTSSSTCEFL